MAQKPCGNYIALKGQKVERKKYASRNKQYSDYILKTIHIEMELKPSCCCCSE